MKILVIDPGSTSTKIGIFHGNRFVLKETLRHDRKLIDSYPTVNDQESMRYEAVKSVLDNHPELTGDFDAVAARGGLIRPVAGGTYLINEQMLADLANGVSGQHASNLAGLIGYRFAEAYHCKAYTVDPVIIDEFTPLARLSGLKAISRKSKFHALNQKAVARQTARKIGKDYNKANFIVAHLGSGISIGVHRRGRVIDVNDALDGDGPFSPERTGSLPVNAVLELIKNGIYTLDEMMRLVSCKGGLYSYLGTIDLLEIEARIADHDPDARLILEGMAYQTAKEIGSCAAVLKGKLDGIILTGGLAKSRQLMKTIKSYIRFLGKVFIVPGEFELEALASGVNRVLLGQEKAKIYGVT